MAAKVDWYYHRKNCMTCQRMDEFLAERDATAKETVNARKDRLGPEEALRLAHAANTIVVAKGKNVVRFDMKKDPPDDETLLAHLIGPTGNLRAPTVRKGKTLLVGFNAEAFAPQFA